MTHDSMIAVIAAHRDGKKVQFLPKIGCLGWTEISPWPAPCNFDFTNYEYRIAPSPPKPREWWIALDTESNIVGGMPYRTGTPVGPIIHVIEVLPSTGEETPI